MATMSCPCRLASGKREKDADSYLPLPVTGRKIVREYGSCYCNLYVSPEWNEGKIEHKYVSERRPAEKSNF